MMDLSILAAVRKEIIRASDCGSHRLGVGIPPTGAEMMPATVPAAALIDKAQRLYHGLNVDHWHSSLILIKGTTVS